MAFFIGFMHSFEADHLAAVSNLLTTRKNATERYKEGFFWGIGHSAIIFFIGLLILVLKLGIKENAFSHFEAFVGVMLILIGIYRIYNIFFKKDRHIHTHRHNLALGVGLVHGLAGSGAVVALAVTKTTSEFHGLAYLLLFGLGSVLGMFFASFVLSKVLYLQFFQKYKVPYLFSIFAAFFSFILGILIVDENVKTFF